MKNKIIILGIFSFLAIFLSLYLSKDFLDSNKSSIMEKIEEQKKEEIVSGSESEIVRETSTTENKTAIAEDKNTENNFKSEIIKKEIKNKPGQLVRHLYDIDSVPSPKGLAFSKDNKEIWVTMLLNQKRGASIFKSENGNKIKDIDLAGGGGVEVIFSKDGARAYISQMETASIFEIEVSSKKILRNLETKSAWTKILELAKDGKTIFASNWSGNDVSEINLETGKLIRRISTVKTPRGLYATKDGKYLYVLGFDRGEIQKIDLETGKGKVIFKSGGAMRHVVGDEERGLFFVSDMGKNIIWQVSLKDDKVEKFADTDFNPNTIALSPDKKILFVSCRGRNYSADNYYIPGPEWGSVLLFDVENGKMLDAIVAGNQPTALDVSSDGKLLAFSDFLDNRIEVFEIPSYEILKQGAGGRSQIYKSELIK